MSEYFKVIHVFTSTSENTDLVLLLFFLFVVIGTFLIEWKCRETSNMNVIVKAEKLGDLNLRLTKS